MASLPFGASSLQDLLEAQTYHLKADMIFGRYLRNGYKATNFVADLLYAAFLQGRIRETAITQVLTADLLWAGEERKTKQLFILVIETTWLAKTDAIERAITRTAILRRIGLNALGVVGSQEWTDAERLFAYSRGVVTATDGVVDATSWQVICSTTQAHSIQ